MYNVKAVVQLRRDSVVGATHNFFMINNVPSYLFDEERNVRFNFYLRFFLNVNFLCRNNEITKTNISGFRYKIPYNI